MEPNNIDEFLDACERSFILRDGAGTKYVVVKQLYSNDDRTLIVERIDNIMDTEGILEKARQLLNGERMDSYGDSNRMLLKTRDLFRVLTGKNMLRSDIAMIMICLKLARESFQHKEDNLIDLCGYADIYHRAVDLEIVEAATSNAQEI